VIRLLRDALMAAVALLVQAVAEALRRHELAKFDRRTAGTSTGRNPREA
jgi:hypothetical protein